jgi:hypothetical protein
MDFRMEGFQDRLGSLVHDKHFRDNFCFAKEVIFSNPDATSLLRCNTLEQSLCLTRMFAAMVMRLQHWDDGHLRGSTRLLDQAPLLLEGLAIESTMECPLWTEFVLFGAMKLWVGMMDNGEYTFQHCVQHYIKRSGD